MLKVVGPEHPEQMDQSAAAGSLLDELIRDGARQMLAAALQAEVVAYIDQFADVVDQDGHRWWSATAHTSSGTSRPVRAR